ncbi:hypothetical protein V5799_003427 [Amblyomma americanum]|uniref:Secreted protein n=1 Tax=Amblyomma americanum TaxID=6943 RepID=A0AAQ4D900_AMBAM
MRCGVLVIACFLVSGLSMLVNLGVSAGGACAPIFQSPEIGDRATCPFTTTIDMDPNRIPSELPVVKCNCPGSICSEMGDFRCQEVRSTFKVAYRVGGGSNASEFSDKAVDLTTSCVCVVSKTLIARSGVYRPQETDGFGKPAKFK